MRLLSWVGVGGLMAAAAHWAATAPPAASRAAPPPGKDLVARYQVPAALISRDGSLLADRAPWVGPEQSAGAGRNPYTIVLTVTGVARQAGEVRARWQTGWSVRETANATREVLIAVPPQAQQALAAGQAVTLTTRSGPVSFRGERTVAPLLGLVRTLNLDVHQMQVEVWSGSAPAAWLPEAPPLLPTLAGIGLLAWFALPRRRSGERDAPGRWPTSSVAPTTFLPPMTTLPPEHEVGAQPEAMPLLAEPASPEPEPVVVAARPDHAAAVTDALRQILAGAPVVASVPDETRPPRRRRRR